MGVMRMLFRAVCPLGVVILAGCSNPPAQNSAVEIVGKGLAQTAKAETLKPAELPPAPAPQTPETPPRAVDVLAAGLAQAQAPMAPQSVTPESPVAAVSPDELPAEQNAAVEAVLDEVEALRKEMASLRHELSGQITDLTEQLKEENQALREEVARLNAAEGAQSRVPAPKGGKRAEQPVEANEAAQSEPEPAPEQVETPAPKGPPRPFVFTSVKEWGRAPKEAAQVTPKAQSLAGVVGTVPPGSRENDLILLGKQLREKYKDYDNINIEVFDDADAARQFADRNGGSSAHRVLSVSKHEASGRDAILVYHKGIPVDVSENAPAPTKEAPPAPKEESPVQE
jgi:hypothetical protein